MKPPSWTQMILLLAMTLCTIFACVLAGTGHVHEALVFAQDAGSALITVFVISWFFA